MRGITLAGGLATLYHGDNIDVLRAMPDNYVDSIVTDPPYGLSDHSPEDVQECIGAWLAGEEYDAGGGGFMNRSWDAWVPGPEIWRECYRVLKPGGYLMAFASTRTDDLMSLAIRLAGFRKHPFIAWVTGQGFPKATNLSKQFDKDNGAEREVVGVRPGHEEFANRGNTSSVDGLRNGNLGDNGGFGRPWMDDQEKVEKYHMETAPASDEAKQWNGWYYGLQSLKPSIEPILLFQKPPDGRMVDNVRRWGTGALNIDKGRVDGDAGAGVWGSSNMTCQDGRTFNASPGGEQYRSAQHPQGRWPANLIHDNSDEVVGLFPDSKSTGGSASLGAFRNGDVYGKGQDVRWKADPGYGDTGSAARFFKACPLDDPDDDVVRLVYEPKASSKDRDEGLDEFSLRRNTHNTVKPTSLMQYLIRLATPPNGVTLDLFMGSGSSGKAAMLEGFGYVGIEIDAESFEIAVARTMWAYQQPKQLELF